MKKKVLVVDLDGTLYSINTFHYFIKYLIYYCIKSLDLILLTKILVIISSRGFKLISHSKMKYGILKAIAHKTLIDYKKFVNNISVYKRNIPLINESSFDIRILATAAPLCYASIIARNECFDLCLATNFPHINFNDEFENTKELKKKKLMNHLFNDDIYEIDTLITDHIDDLPIMKLAKKIIIVKPNHYTKAELKRHNISFELMS